MPPTINSPLARQKTSGSKERVVFVKCVLSAGAFPMERIFKLESTRGDLYGTAPLHYCYTTQGRRLNAAEATEAELPGLVAGVELEQKADGEVRVYLPNAEVYDVDRKLLEPVGLFLAR